MKKVVSILGLILALGFVSCTDNTEIVEKQTQSNEKASVNKEDIETTGGGGEEDTDFTED